MYYEEQLTLKDATIINEVGGTGISDVINAICMRCNGCSLEGGTVQAIPKYKC